MQIFEGTIKKSPVKIGRKTMEQVAVIKVYFLAGKTANEALELLQLAYRDKALKSSR